MKQYLVFAGSDYYPSGGWKDFKGSFDSIDEAKKFLNTEELRSYDWWQIVDTTTQEVVERDANNRWF
jgi:hypothetical protein